MPTVRSPQLRTAPAVVREQSGGPTMRVIDLEKFGGLDTDAPRRKKAEQ